MKRGFIAWINQHFLKRGNEWVQMDHSHNLENAAKKKKGNIYFTPEIIERAYLNQESKSKRTINAHYLAYR